MEKIFKNFREWFLVKEKIHTINSKPPLFKEGEVWWCALGENIGVEINGKSRAFSRPVLVFKKMSQQGFIGIPLSTQEKQGTWYTSFVLQDKLTTANLSQLKFFSSKRMYTKIGTLSDQDYKKVKEGFLSLFY